MNRILAALFGLRFGERRMALMMTAYHFLLLVTLYLLKPVRDSLFLTERSALELPFVFMLTTVAVLPVAALHVRAGRRVRLSRLINGVAVILILNLLGLRWLVQLESFWVYYLLYAWVSIYAVLVTSQFWLLANAVFTAAESKRIFPLLSAGAILGSVVGGEVTGLLVDRWGMHTENLLLVCAGLLAVSSLIVVWVHRKSRRREGPSASRASEGAPANLFGVVRTLRTSRHLQFIIGVIALAVIATTFVDYQFKTVAAQAFPTEGSLTSFMGRFYGRVSLIAFLLQVFLVPRLIRVLGVGGALSLLPLTLALGSVGMFVAGGLWAGTALRGIDQSLKHSIDKTGRELLFVPIDLQKKKRVKVFIDLFFDQGMQGVGGLLLLFLTLVVELTVQQLSLVVLGLLAVWVGMVLLARSSYINQFRDVLQQNGEESGGDDEEGKEHPARSFMSFEEVKRSLWSRSAAEVLRGLERLEEACDEQERRPRALPVEALQQLLDHRVAVVRRRAIRLLREAGVKGLAEAIAVHLEDADPEVRLEAARYLYRNFEAGRGLFLQQGLEHDDPRVRAAAVGLIAKDGGPEERALLTRPLLRDLLTYEGEAAEDVRLEAARALSVVDWPGRDALLIRLMDDPSRAVAERALKSAGQTGERVFVAPLLEHLKDEGREEEARRSLAAFGERILGTLYDYLADEQVDARLRRRLPAVLCMKGTQASVDVLLLLSRGRVTVPVWHEVVRALSRLRRHGRVASASLHFPEGPVRDAVQDEAARYAALGQVLHVHRRTPAASARAVQEDALRDARRRSLERLCRLLGLRYRQDDLHNAYRGLVSEDAALRSSAIELLDNVLEWDLKRDLLPLLDDPDGQRVADQESSPFGLDAMNDWGEALVYLLDSRDPALTARALAAAAREAAAREDASPALRERLEAATRDPHQEVRAAARDALDEETETEAGRAPGARAARPQEAPASPVSSGI